MADVLLLDGRWALGSNDKGELYLNASWSNTHAEFSDLQMVAAPDVPMDTFFPDGLPYGHDPNATLKWHNYDFTAVDEYSRLDQQEVRATLGLRWQLAAPVRFWTQLSHYKVTDDAKYLQDTSGSVDLVMLGFDWIF